MLTLRFRNFNEAYYETNRLLLQKPQHIDYLNSTMGWLDNLFISCKSTQCDKINLGALGYKRGKWTRLVKTYLGDKKVEEIRNLGVGSTGLSAGFDFLRKTSGNGACMLGIVISRPRRGKHKWSKATIMWRTTELQRRWAADLILIHRILELIPNSDFKQIDLYMATAYQSAMYIIPILEPVFNIKSKDLDPNHSYTRVIITREAKYFKPDKSPHRMLASGERLVKLYKEYEKGIIPKFIGVQDCKLVEEEKP